MGEPVLPLHARKRITPYQIAQIVLGVGFLVFLGWRLYTVIVVEGAYGPDTWLKFAISGLIIGSVYALITIGYTLVYAILRMINFAHSEVFMVGAFAGFFVFEALKSIMVGDEPRIPFIDAQPLLSIVLAFLAGIAASTITGVALERLAYRPLRRAPRLVPLISAVGASIFLQNAAQLMFGPQRRTYYNLPSLDRNLGWTLEVAGKPVLITYTGVFTFVLAILLLVSLNLIVQRTRLGRAMRAVSEDKPTAALMGIDVDAVISRTFAISGVLAGSAGVMWGLHYGQIHSFVGFIPGIKAFTAAVLGGIGNIPGAMLGAMTLGLIESMGPGGLGMDFQLKDVIAFSILVLVLVFRPSGLLGEVLSQEKL
ncbi:MAG TPA: branched-chain amino acid ABC transporter permease [Anaerolineales bacterium]|nr:branched-chain amino acid ABC transporter permease [Anaerolineales bacterium]